MEKKKVNKYPIAFRKMALERLKTCPSATELSAELGIHRTLLYKWRDKIEPVEDGPGPAANSGERELRKQIRELKRALGEKVLEVDFSKVPCKRSRLDARTAAALAGRRLRASPGANDHARQPKCGSDVPTGGSEPREFLSFAERASTHGRRRRGEVCNSADRVGTPVALRIAANRRHTARGVEWW